MGFPNQLGRPLSVPIPGLGMAATIVIMMFLGGCVSGGEECPDNAACVKITTTSSLDDRP